LTRHVLCGLEPSPKSVTSLTAFLACWASPGTIQWLASLKTSPYNSSSRPAHPSLHSSRLGSPQPCPTPHSTPHSLCHAKHRMHDKRPPAKSNVSRLSVSHSRFSLMPLALSVPLLSSSLEHLLTDGDSTLRRLLTSSSAPSWTCPPTPSRSRFTVPPPRKVTAPSPRRTGVVVFVLRLLMSSPSLPRPQRHRRREPVLRICFSSVKVR
jgi:hypothetical protein